MYRLSLLSTISLIILVIGGANWGLVGLADFDLVAFLFGFMSPLSRLVYSLVGLCALHVLYLVYRLKSAN